ncbi:MAG: hypothetical protein AAGA96_05435, partial [Verrucomicrobiota bacterium]
RQLKRRETGSLFYSLPPIRYLTDAIQRLLVIGTVLLSVGISAAFFMDDLPDMKHLLVSGGVWVVYALILAVHFLRHLSPQRLSILSMASFLFALIALSVL